MTFDELRHTLADLGQQPLTVSGHQLTYRGKDGTAFTAFGATLDEGAEFLATQLKEAGELEPQPEEELPPLEAPIPGEPEPAVESPQDPVPGEPPTG
jgi:hypothetical protein